MRRLIGGVVAALTLFGTGAYVFIDLYRWEWQRATLTGILFIATEVGVGVWVITSRLDRLRRDTGHRRERVLVHLQNAQDAPTNVFAWLKPDVTRTNVFVPLLMGAGLVISAVAWAVERIARATAGVTTDTHIAGRLAALGPPQGGFLDPTADELRVLRGPMVSGR